MGFYNKENCDFMKSMNAINDCSYRRSLILVIDN